MAEQDRKLVKLRSDPKISFAVKFNTEIHLYSDELLHPITYSRCRAAMRLTLVSLVFADLLL